MKNLTVNLSSNYKCSNINYNKYTHSYSLFNENINKQNKDIYSYSVNTPDNKTEKEKENENNIKIGITAAITVIGSAISKKAGIFSKIKNLFKWKKLVDTSSKELFPFAQKHPLKAPRGIMSEDGLVITHLTDYLPRDGYIDSARSAINGARDSVHFAVNHGVTAHVCDWSTKPYAIIIPMKSALGTAENKFVGGIAGDFYSAGRVKIPKGSVIIRRNTSIPAGKYKIGNASKIKELRYLKGIKLIETSEENMKTTVDNIVQKLGYELKDTSSPFFWGKETTKSKFREFKRFNNFLKAHGMIPMAHQHTPNGKIEYLIYMIFTRSTLGREWTFVHDGKIISDAKEETLKLIQYIEKYAKETKYPVSFNLITLKEIVKQSKTPQEASQKIYELMGITHTIENQDGLAKIKALNHATQELFLSAQYITWIGGKGVSAFDKSIFKYLESPNQSRYSDIWKNIKIAQKEYEDFDKIFKDFEIESDKLLALKKN